MAFKYQVSKPYLAGRELEYLTEAVNSGWISSQGPFVRRFEEEFAQYNGTAYGVACSSGTTALTLALRALGVGPGDEVLVPEFTMVATAWAVTYTGAVPVFVDCGDDLNIDVSLIEARITPRTKVIMPVHVYGRRCDMDAIMKLAHEYNLRVVEDSAEAHGVRPVGDIACFSLFANKIISAGEGGVCVTNSEHLAQQMAHLRSMAFSKEHDFIHKKLAYNFRMTNMQAAVALAQLEQIDEILAIRKRIEKHYDSGLDGIDGITIMPSRDVLWMYDIRAERREELREFLTDAGIETRPFFQPMSRQPMYFNPDWPALNAARFAADGLYLPTDPGLAESDQEWVIGKVREFYLEGQATGRTRM
ncbi:DegT/DnrJ/EryC1/StrS family aminotransferase [Streptosporangium sp. NBC_01755]|uniref:DegT/DnrJ/EryC1/StrS family aminotransferase n=1 Tax=unclassified Streptosporangium TaxID=2632669 RepID=UPI002DD950E7|nr:MULTISPECIES: DegT/DnrJ/EryC1/StrS family aminotransferase [unclassified Streptosporangium]WSA29352.1 DegT/DnrJ/EryC1/StrS family aminotransferase [Streptosporangium sp. NBC_01810]WSC99205.1 DegT/DnrJ/EryC1/StrS family aminotransferase [Streptosporangium sp. NBC_01755]